jgi:hypothetical protein
MRAKYLFIILVILISFCGFGQDSIPKLIRKDQPYVLEFLKGNSWTVSGSYSRSKVNELGVEVGRTYGDYSFHPVPLWMTSTYGFGVRNAFLDGSQSAVMGNFFYEMDVVIFALRADYMYDFTNRQSYIRPAIGLSFCFVDILYNYSFCLNGNSMFKHGFTIRINGFFPISNWDHRAKSPYKYMEQY